MVIESSTCLYGFRPYPDNHTNALNPCFLALTHAVCSTVFLIWGLFQLLSLLEIKITRENLYTPRLSKKHSYHLCFMLSQIVVVGLQLFVTSIAPHTPTVSKMLYSINLIYLTAISVPIQYLQFYKSTCCVASQLFYFLFQILFLTYSLAQRFMHNGDDYNIIPGTLGGALELLLLINSINLLVYEVAYYQCDPQLLAYYYKNNKRIENNAISNIAFFWMNPFITETYRNKKLKDPNHLPHPPVNSDIRKMCITLRSYWEQEKWTDRKSLLLALWKTFGKTVVIAMVYETTRDILTVLEPQFLRLFINYFDPKPGAKYPPLNGLFIAFSLFLTNFLSVFLNNQFYIYIFEAGLGSRGTVMAMVYQKFLRLSEAARSDSSGGDIINLMSVDALRVQRFFENSQNFVGAPIQIVIVLFSLYVLLGKSALVGLAIMVIMLPVNTFLSRKVKNLSKTQMTYKDTRIRTISEILNSIRSIKLYAWEKPMLEKIYHVRNDLELRNLKKVSIVSSFIFLAWNLVPLLVSCSTFAIYSFVTDVPLTPDIIFPALALFNILNSAISTIPSLISSVIETTISLDRLRNFLLNEEINTDWIEYQVPIIGENLPLVEIQNASFLWRSKRNMETITSHLDEEAAISSVSIALRSISTFIAPEGELTCIVGRVGSGKSTLLKAIMGRLPIVAGKNRANPKMILRTNSMSYCSQEAWIMNASVKDNILFGYKFDESYYMRTLKACQLLPDLEILPDGDETIVGEKGVSLSGGQKARLALARAVYARTDLYLLDDVLSAVDASVSKKLIDMVLNKETGLLKDKTVILATNNIPILKHSKYIYILDKGEIIGSGSYQELINSADQELIKKVLKDYDTENQPTLESEISSNEKQVSVAVDQKNIIQLSDSSSERALLLGEDDELGSSLRRASLATLKPIKFIETSNIKKKTEQEAEKTAEGRVKTKVYITYVKACGLTGVLLFFLFMIMTKVTDLAENFWLKYWSESNEENESNKHVMKYVGVYIAIGLLSAIFSNLRSVIMMLFCCLRGSQKLHDRMVVSVIRSPMKFFESTPIGRIVNRFSSDVDALDTTLQHVFSMFFRAILDYIITLLLVSYNMPWFFVINCLLLVLYFYYQAYYMTVSRELKRLTSVTYSPILSLMSETLAGNITIAAYGHIPRFEFLNFERVQYNINCFFAYRSSNRWLSIRLQVIGAAIVLATAILALATAGTRRQLSAGMVGLLMSYSLQVTNALTVIVRSSVLIENSVVSVERISEYCELPSEAPEHIEGSLIPKDWPSHGSIEFQNYSTSYKAEYEPVLKNISFNVKPGQKVGIVGRTGAGKSTLSMSLFRLLEATSGTIKIDGIDISKIGLTDLRSHLAIIPQDAQAFEGTVKYNLDPFDRYTTSEIIAAIDLAHLREHIVSISNVSSRDQIQHISDEEILETKILENGSNISAGQRQLLCLARSLLSSSKVLVLDEATAAVDMNTDKIVQNTIRKEFKDRTILTIAHRIDTVMDSDMILVLDQGIVKEYDTPENLLSDKRTMFYDLCLKGGYVK